MERDESTPAPAVAFSPAAERALIILAVIGCGFVMWAAQSILVPTVAAVVLALALNPVVQALERLGLPTPVAAVAVIVGAVAVIAGAALALAPSVAQWIEHMPEILRTIESKTRSLQEWVQSFQAASSKLDQLANPTPSSGGAQQVTVVQPFTGELLQSVPVVLSQTVYVIALALFITIVREPYRRRLILLPKDRANRLRVARIMNETLSQVSQYLFVVASINTGLGAATAVCFLIAGVPYALAWGLVFAVANFIPYIGPTGTMILCGVVQLTIAPTLLDAAIAPLIMFLLNLIESNWVTPWLVSRRIAVSSLAIFVTVAVFLWLWGPLAAILTVPLLILVSAVARHVPALEPIGVLLLAESESSLDVAETARARHFAKEEALGREDEEVERWWARVGRRLGLMRAASS